MRTNLLNCRKLSKLWMFAGMLLVSSAGFAQSGGGDTKAGIGALASSSNNKIIKLEVTQSNYQATKIVPSVANGTWVEYDLWITSENTQYYGTGFSGTYRSTSSNLSFTFQDSNNNNCLGANDYLEWGSPTYNPSTNTYDYFIGMYSEENTSCTPIVTLSQASGNYGIQANVDQYGGTKLDYWDNGTIYSSGILPTVNMPWGTAVAVSGNGNSALGYYAGGKITSGQYNTLMGFEAGKGLMAGNMNTIVGSGSWNIAKDYQLFSGSNNIIIGNNINNIDGTISDALVIANGENVKLFSPSNNNLYVGYGSTLPSSYLGSNFKLDVQGTFRARSGSSSFSTTAQSASLSSFSNTAASSRFLVEKGRGSAIIPASVVANDELGSVFFKGYHGSPLASHDAASITTKVKDVTGAGVFGTNMEFAVRKSTATGLNSLSNLLELNAEGYAKATEKFKIGTVSTGSSTDEILVRSTSDGEVKSRSVTDVLSSGINSTNPYIVRGYGSDEATFNGLSTERSFIGSIFTKGSQYSTGTGNRDTPFGIDKWYTVINNRHRNGEGDGNVFGSQIAIGMLTDENRMVFRNQNNGNWTGWNEIWHTGNFNPSNYLNKSPSGNVGIGTANPANKLQIVGTHQTTNFNLHYGDSNPVNNADLTLWASEPGWTWTGTGIGNNVYNSDSQDGVIRINNSKGGSYIRLLDQEMKFNIIGGSGANKSAMSINSSGFVGIGTGDAMLTEALNVNGSILTEGVKVNPTEFPDYVFKPQYKLPSLKDVENFVKENSHLPEVPSEAEVKKNGLELGEMSVILLKKVEELTLYMIEKDKQLEKANQRIEELSKKVDKLSKK